MSVCLDCALWVRNFPHVFGVCTIGPREFLGSCVPASSSSVGSQLAAEFEGCTATYPSSTCSEWEMSCDAVSDIPYENAEGDLFSFLAEELEDELVPEEGNASAGEASNLPSNSN